MKSMRAYLIRVYPQGAVAITEIAIQELRSMPQLEQDREDLLLRRWCTSPSSDYLNEHFPGSCVGRNEH
jgi:hypothetical protein